MKIRDTWTRCLLAVGAGAVIAGAGIAVPAAAHASPVSGSHSVEAAGFTVANRPLDVFPPFPTPGPGWYYGYMRASVGNGCMVPTQLQTLSPLTVQTCNINNSTLVGTSYVWARVIVESGRNVLQIATTDGDGTWWDYGFSGTQFKLETPSDSNYFRINVANNPVNYNLYANAAGTNYAVEGAAGAPLHTPGSATAPADTWWSANGCIATESATDCETF